MGLKSRLAAVGIAAVTAGLLPLGGAAFAQECNSEIQIFFYSGATVAERQVTTLLALDSPVLGCIVGEEAGLGVDIFYVLPGSTFATGRDNAAVCQDTLGSVVGLGANGNDTWTKDSDCGGATDIGTGGASSPLYPIDPTAFGSISAATGHGNVTYRTVDS